VNQIYQGRCKLSLFLLSTQIHKFRCAVRFTTGSEREIRQIAHLQVFNNVLYDNSTGRYLPALFGPLDNRLVLKDPHSI
jgi:hypothetical protein